ncbi:dynamin family protein [Jeotgalibacillus soli]|uniref:Dynamin N-terminal domain-containing protein n=1 Tax=Jeotgalibacillus soli TaxID=889306 RepID=A0A0C2RQY1_9BACL|nr:dynamin family protein [Jeotgalibacillus soli]KIL44154.1 hypothetical protein KP78_31180 [Jeotgalibacillus soli]
MVKEESLSDKELLAKLANFYNTCLKNKDEARAKKTELLAKKIEKKQLIVAFCGHFSAGKSTMINTLMDEEILPSSPIPTSANLIAIHAADENQIFVTTTAGKIIELLPPLNETVIGELGRDGLQINKIDLYRSNTKLPDNVTVMDTPGIDSVDDAHKQSTESAIHLADIVFYVMDYNHVQSQMNFEYIRNLSQHGVSVHAIINQIDKHREEELPFSVFKQSTTDAFESWGASPIAYHYTSLKDKTHPENELQKVQSYIQELLLQRDEVILQTAKASLSLLMDEHKTYMENEYVDMLDTYQEWLSDEDLLKQETIFKLEEELINEKHFTSTEEWSQSFDKEREQLLDHAYLMPADVRDIASRFLETLQPSFKIGLLFSSKKTEQERNIRKRAFINSLEKTVQARLVWHMKNTCHQALKKAGIVDSDWSARIEEINLLITDELLLQFHKKGAEVNGQYVLHYCESLANGIRVKAKNILEEIKQQILTDYHDLIEQKSIQSEIKLMTIQKKANALRSLLQHKNRIKKTCEKQKKIHYDEADLTINAWQNKWRAANALIIQTRDLSILNFKKTDKEIEKVVSLEESRNVTDHDEGEIISKLLRTGHAITSLKGFDHQREQLFRRAERLQSKDFTVALFGAFSAGKSSFANALLGEKVLPVSPNPTTAAINRIKPPTEERKHGAVTIYFKTKEHLLRDLQSAMQGFGYEPQSLVAAFDASHKLMEKTGEINGLETKKSFIRAFLKGWPAYEKQLGAAMETDRSEFEGFVANEHQSCFVESIDLYYDSPVARQGITLVDTPGADSINARHTDVSFDYIRNADAILFVTYYNHAFARADREFLIQLGRVKESFELDKMFFIVNAADLADSEKEKEQVLAYVQDQLTAFGIRFPRIYGVSSIQAISFKKEIVHQSGIELFKSEFNHFLEYDLQGMALLAAEQDCEMITRRLDRLVKEASQNEEQKIQRLKKLEEAKKRIQSRLSEPDLHSVKKRTEQELAELLHYMKQRVFYRFSDFFKESFNPTLFVHQSNQKALEQALASLLKMLGFDFSQELRVINHRMAIFIQHQLHDQLKLEIESLSISQDELILPNVDLTSKDLLIFLNWFEKTNVQDFKEELSLFKNTKSFFEKNEKRIMRDRLEENLQNRSTNEINAVTHHLQQWISDYLSIEGIELYNRWMADLINQINGSIEGLQSKEMVGYWQEALHTIREGVHV